MQVSRPLYRGCPLLGGSVIRGFTVYITLGWEEATWSKQVCGRSIAVRGDLRWKKLEERREEKQVLYGGRGLMMHGHSRLVKVIMKKMHPFLDSF